mmetsp:Transcript_8940/g.6707  ORF Transcript_8940/g.6707 Transcript_8940/m.6707 type:complete len:161 (+) Transcript_8940:1008-1490(+)
MRQMERKDSEPVRALLKEYLAKFAVHFEFSKEEIEHFLLPREDVVESFVVEDKQTGALTDFVSFYSLPSSVLKHVEIRNLRAAYSFYHVPKKHTLTQLIKDALIIAKKKGYDVFNALDVMENEEFLQELKFGVGDGNLHFYLYNWRIPEFQPKDIATVLV